MKWRPDRFVFLRRRAERLFEQGQTEAARALLSRVDEKQAQLFEKALARSAAKTARQ